MMIFKTSCRINLLFVLVLWISPCQAEESIGKRLILTDKQLETYAQRNINILGVIELDSVTSSNQKLMEFSGLAWDEDENLLYALSDRGYVVHMQPVFEEDILTGVLLIAYHNLKDTGGQPLKHKYADSEGITLLHSNNNTQGDTLLLISFERVPRVIHYTVTGDFIAKEKINNELAEIKNYSGANNSLEAITIQDHYGIITGPERPLKDQNLLSLHTLNNRQWSFKPHNENYGSLVDITVLPDDNLVALERIFPGVFAGVTNVLHQITLSDNALSQHELVVIDPADGFFNDNFEGLTWHKDNRFFMISDDNDNFLQRSLLIYFEIPSLK